ncbi:MAG TPA: tRNA-binding protein [Cytophagaceae bacterium]
MPTHKEFQKFEIRVGTITEVMDFPEAIIPAYKLKISFGEYGIRTSSAQITKSYTKEELLNKQVVAVINFPPKQIANFISECLVLGVPTADGHVILLEPDKEVPVGLSIA